jgi:hypothetical protein
LLDGELGGVRNGNLDQQDGLGFARVELAPVQNARAATSLDNVIVIVVDRHVREV